MGKKKPYEDSIKVLERALEKETLAKYESELKYLLAVKVITKLTNTPNEEVERLIEKALNGEIENIDE